ncbi:MAG TPA: helix-turn-helix domain-containing protein [Rhodopseudomonas sp.]|uniref:winged helix-turn-helix domain-containing protein n=1 Tax=Rhodopseudomonas sp. TaxID=1078 RepID=UPI002ED86E8C
MERIVSLTQTLENLRQSMALAGSLPSDWKLTPKERSLFLALLRNDTVTKQMAIVLLYGTEDRPSRSVDVFMSRIRQKTKIHSVTIETINRTGYRLVDRLVWAKTLKLDAPVEH